MIYRTFSTNKNSYNSLSKEDKLILKILEKVVKDVSCLYSFQLEEGFYPKGITKERLEKAAQDNPALLSPFTYVLEENGKLKAVNYHEHYAKYLQPIARTIEKAAEISTNKSYQAYLKAQAKSLLDGNYGRAYRQWLAVRNSSLDFNLGPFERYLDKIFSIKRTFQAYVGIVDVKNTKLAARNKEVLYTSAKMSFTKIHSSEVLGRGSSVFIESISAMAGYPADVFLSGQHFPTDLETALKYGSKTIIYTSQLKLKFDKLYYPIFKTIFETRFASKYSKELLLEAAGWCVFLYEMGKQLHWFEEAKPKLQQLYDPIDEANGFASGIEHSKHLVVRGLLPQDTLEAIIIVHIIWMIADWLLFKNNIVKQRDMMANSILFNSYLSHGALKISKGISWPNFSRIFFEIEEMTYKLVYFLQKGSYKEAREFIKQNADLRSFEQLSKTLSKINTKI